MLHLDYRDSRPIHQQVRDGLRRLMVTGVLQPGDQLPSVRKLATELAINPNTIQRAMASWRRRALYIPWPAGAALWPRTATKAGAAWLSLRRACTTRYWSCGSWA